MYCTLLYSIVLHFITSHHIICMVLYCTVIYCTVLQDKNWEILETSKGRVDQFRRTMPLISDLKNTAMRPRHWDQIQVGGQKICYSAGPVVVPRGSCSIVTVQWFFYCVVSVCIKTERCALGALKIYTPEAKFTSSFITKNILYWSYYKYYDALLWFPWSYIQT